VTVTLGGADVVTILQTAAGAWFTQAAPAFRTVYTGTTTGKTVALNGRNEVFFRNDDRFPLAAETIWWSDAFNHYLDIDIVFYEGGVTFLPEGVGCAGSSLYLLDIATHEFGHFAGLAHSSVSTATMYAIASWCAQTWRSLDPDDRATIEALYPSSAPATGSPDGTRLPPATSIVDAQGATWTLSGSLVLRNGQWSNGLGSVVTWCGGVIRTLGTDNYWWNWSATRGWSQEGPIDPCTGAPPPACAKVGP
jgi:hypothetical protein